MLVHVSSVVPSSIRPSVWAIGDHTFQSQHRARWQPLHNGCWFYYQSTTGGGTPLFYCSPEPPPSVTHWWFHACRLQLTSTHRNKKHSFFLAFAVLHIQAPTRNRNRTLAYVETTSGRLLLHTNTHIQTRSFAHVLTHTNLGWLPSCASCFFHQHVFTGRGPLCLHYREAINRKASPGVWKLLFGGEPSWGVSPNHCVVQPLIKCSAKCQKERLLFLWMMFSGICARWNPRCPNLPTLMNFSQSFGALTTWLS